MEGNTRESKTSIDYYILPNKIMCSVLGVSPTDRKYSTGGKVFAYFRYTVSLVSILSIFVPEIMRLVVNWGDLKTLTEVGCIITTVGQYIFKMIYLLARKEKTYKLYMELRSLWDSSCDHVERQSYEKFAYWARLITIVFYSLGMWMLSTITIMAAINSYSVQSYEKNRQLPIDVWYGTDVSETPNFETAFVCQLVAAMISCAGLWGIDASCMTTILHVCGQFKLINTWISKIGVVINSQPTDYYRDYPPSIEADLIRCVRHHQRLINLMKEINNLLTPIAFMQIFTSGIEICLSGFAVMSKDSSNELFSISYLATMLMQVMLWCWPGEILIQESLEVGRVAYLDIPWYKLPPTCRRQLLLVILRSQDCCSISALTFERLSFHTLTSVFNTASSYFALLRQMQGS